ncbi:MAG: hypothetical protein EB078_05615 [Proteobacteria bacterium]|nr:hypothetical protein [Pseudomonadota bacterium]NDC24400.1 hypothetical protein [Pseudomonadota bacterium]NDD04362.1 hypothetical protein [Pseudomonadota bacterium]NDG28116.1 hypothetical protein [Pseudomonadota bacterium]
MLLGPPQHDASSQMVTMVERCSMRNLTKFLYLVILISVLGCGVKGNPVPYVQEPSPTQKDKGK